MAGLTTKSGAPTAEARAKYGAKPGAKGLRPGSFPVFDTKHALSALRLRGHAPDPNAVIDKVEKWARDNNDAGILQAVANARGDSDSVSLKKRLASKRGK